MTAKTLWPEATRALALVAFLFVAATCSPAWGKTSAETQKKRSQQTSSPSNAKGNSNAKAPASKSAAVSKNGKKVEPKKLREPVERSSTAARSKNAKPNRKPVRQAALLATPAVLSVGHLAGLHGTADPLDLKSGVALVIDRDSQEVLFSKNSQAVLPIASITKLMTALVVVEAGQPMDELIHIESVDVDETNNRRSRLTSGTSLTRGEMLRLALMSSENRAAYSLSRHYPGGADAFVQAMNLKASKLGMKDTRFVEATGLSAENRSSALDLARLVTAASAHSVIREFSTAQEAVVPVGSQDKITQFRSTNGLIGNPQWDITLQKTGYIAAAGRCLVMQASLAGRQLTMVLLDSAGKYSRFGDAERIRQWLLKDRKVLTSTISLTSVDAVN